MVVVVVFVVVLLLDDSSAKTDADTVQRQITTAALKLCIFRLRGTLEKKLKTQRFAFAELNSVGQNVIIQAIHVNYTSWYGKLSENYAESKK